VQGRHARHRRAPAADRQQRRFRGLVVIDKVKNSEGANGYNADTNTYEDLIKAGVIDPTKVVRFALQNAGSVAGLMLTTEAMIAEKPEEKADDPMPPVCHGRHGRRYGRHGRHGRHG
jgi:chaperonin GroEL